MLPLRYGKFWLGLGWLGLFMAVVGSLVSPDYIPRIYLNDKILHAAYYLVLMLWFAGIYRKSRYLPIGVGLFLFGWGLELLQGLEFFSNHHMHSGDLAANAVGITVALLLALAGVGGWCGKLERLIAGGSSDA